MREYLALHNMTMLDFWILLGLWIAGAVLTYLLIRWWFRNMKKEDVPNPMLTLSVIAFLVVIGPFMTMGLWHFINMVLHLTLGSDLYFLVS